MPLKDRITHWTRTTMSWTRRNVPPGLRFVLGVLLIIGGVFGFLPVLGFWMIPLGIAIAALDLRPLGTAIKRLIQKRR